MYKDNCIEIKGLIESSFLDWDGKIVTTLYLPNCNFKCPFCHNWELTDHPEKFNTVTRSEIDRKLRVNHDFIDGICITGGEPTLYDGLHELISHLREQDFSIKLDTNGSNPELLADLIKENKLEYVAMDIKGPLDERYYKLAGKKINLDKIIESIQIIIDSSIDYEFRTTMVPSLINEHDILDLGKDFTKAKKFVFQQFVPDHARNKDLRSVRPFTNEILESFQALVKNKIANVVLRGMK